MKPSEEKKLGEFELNRTYTKIMTKEKLIELIARTYDKEFIVVFLPRTKSNSDILIRSKENKQK